jgi:hypothetical protein
VTVYVTDDEYLDPTADAVYATRNTVSGKFHLPGYNAVKPTSS